jgi:hypothetical protein
LDGQSMTYACDKCTVPGGKTVWHHRKSDCPYNRASPKPDAIPKTEAPVAPKPIALVQAKTTISGLNFPESTAEVIKGGPTPVLEPVEVDYIVGAERTLSIWNFGFRAIMQVTIWVDEWYEWEHHIPARFFQVSKTGEMAINEQPRNFYARAVTWVCKRAGCKTLEQANSLIDSVLFFETFGGLAVVIVLHYRQVFKESPKVLRKKKAKEAKEEAAKRKTATILARTVPAEVVE